MSRPTFRPTLDSLEARHCPAPAVVTPYLSARILTVDGTDNADVINVEKVGTNLRVAGRLYALAAVDKIVLVGEGGNDTLIVSPLVNLWTRIYGGNGNDVIYGGNGSDNVYGGAGNDVIYGRGGNDALYGGPGTDLLDGGAGSNILDPNAPARGRSERSAIESEIVRLTNLERTRRGLRALTFNSLLNNAAYLHSADMAGLRRMDHTLYGTLQPTPASRLELVGYVPSWWAENVAFGYTSAAEVVAGWMTSAGHRQNILNPNLREIGVGVVAATNGRLYFTQAFGSPG